MSYTVKRFLLFVCSGSSRLFACSCSNRLFVNSFSCVRVVRVRPNYLYEVLCESGDGGDGTRDSIFCLRDFLLQVELLLVGALKIGGERFVLVLEHV